MNFFTIDLVFLTLFILFIIIFLTKKRKKIDREGILFIYRTKFGIRLINRLAKKYKKFLLVFAWTSIGFGYLFMFFAILLLIYSLEVMYSALVLPKAPPIMPIIPYFPSLFKIKFLPPLYFTYWILIILIIAVSHEFAHGIFAKIYGVKLKSTGFGFLGPFIAAFVEPDEKQLRKKKIKNQLAILSAGSFANFLVALIFILLLQIFFLGFYKPIGLNWFYAMEKINVSEINSISNYTFQQFISLNLSKINLTKFKIQTKSNKTYYLDLTLWNQQKEFLNKTKKLIVFVSSPAYLNNLSGALISINGKKIKKIKDIEIALKNKKPNETVKVLTNKDEWEIKLASHPLNKSKGFLGISYFKPTISAYLFSFYFYGFNPYLKVEPRFNGKILEFFKNLFYWLILIGLSVALFNMLPFAFLDGGRVSYLTFLYLFKDKKKAMKAYSIFNYFVLLLFLALFFIWFFRI